MWLNSLLAGCASGSSVHGVGRLAGQQRKVHVKLVWLLALLVSLCYCAHRVAEAYRKFASNDVATTVRQNALNFEFPDVYICNESPISGSFSVNMNRPDSELLSLYRRLVNDSVASLNIRDPSVELDTYAIRLVNSLPFKFLSDKMGHRLSSMLYVYRTDNMTLSASILHHPLYINCFNMNWSGHDSLSSLMQVILFLDTPLPEHFDNSTEQDLHKFESDSVNLKPVDWDFNYGTDFTVSTGFRVFLTPRGQYPSELDAQLLIGPSQKHDIKIAMQDVAYNRADFFCHCSESCRATADFLNPYSGERQTFKYSHAVCLYREMARLSQERLNCSVWRGPIPWEYRALPSCFNVTQASTGILMDRRLIDLKAELLDRARRVCNKAAPCRSRSYTHQYSASGWPSTRAWANQLSKVVEQRAAAHKQWNPGIDYLLYNSSVEEAKGSMLQMVLASSGQRGKEIQLSLAYNFSSLIADVGGLLGLFLGMSLLSVLELLELLHDCLLAACNCRGGSIGDEDATDGRDAVAAAGRGHRCKEHDGGQDATVLELTGQHSIQIL